MTGTPFCILPVTSLNSLKIGNNKNVIGKITQKLLLKWSENVGLDIVGQIKEYGNEIRNNNVNAPTPYQFKL